MTDEPRGQCGRCDVPFTCAAICARTGERITEFQGAELLKAYQLGWDHAMRASGLPSLGFQGGVKYLPTK
jgi:hypothetical protein